MLKKIYWNFFRRNIFGITGPLRVLPDFIMIGSMKCGTTSLYYDICEHPCASPAAYDEIGFFDSNFHLGLNWYRSMFPTKRRIEDIRRKEGVAITGEDTPFYFWNPVAAKRIQKLLPNIKLITILRNPIDRAYSNYNAAVKNKKMTLSFEDAIKTEEARIKGIMEKMKEDANYISTEYSLNALLNRGKFYFAIKRWMDVFPKNQFFIIKSEDFFLIINILTIYPFFVQVPYLVSKDK